MKRVCLAIGVLILAAGWAALGAAEPKAIPVDTAPAAPWQPAQLVVPEGYTVEVVAAPPLVEHPMMGGFDDKGRLYLAESAGQNLKFDELQKVKPNYVRRLEDTDGDGKFDKTTIFANNLEFPMGALWHDGAVYVASPPSIWKLIDTDDDGVADQRIELVNKFGSTGNAADIHGCFLSPDGRIYWVDGYHGHEIEQPKSPLLKGQSAYIFSCKPDGSDVQIHCGGGMDNPVEVAWTDTGEMLGSVNILLRNPRVDCLVHWMYGGLYPHREAAMNEIKRTGDWMPPLARYGHIAISGMTILRSDAMGKDFQNQVLITEFNSGRVVRSALQRAGSTYRSTETVISSPKGPDFHATDVIEDADGSLLVVDTGGWFRIGCPTSQVAKPNILGGIYRIRKKDARPVADPRGMKIDWNAESGQIVKLLDDPRFAVRDKAIAVLARRGAVAGAAVGVVGDSLKTASPQGKRNAIWALTRIGTPEALAAIRSSLADSDATVRESAVHSIFATRDAAAVDTLKQKVNGDEPSVKREAAAALGRLKNPAAIPALLEGLKHPVDRLHEHALIYALIEIDQAGPVAAALSGGEPQVRRAALIALDQMDHGNLSPRIVLPLLESDDAAIRQAALEVISHRSNWAEAVNPLIASWLGSKPLPEARRQTLQSLLTAFLLVDSTQQLIGKTLSDAGADASTRLLALNAIAGGQNLALHESWRKPLHLQLSSADPAMIQAALAAVAAIKTGEYQSDLKRIGSDTTQSAAIRTIALQGSTDKNTPLNESDFTLMVSQLGPSAPAAARLASAKMLMVAKLTREQGRALIPSIGLAGPMELAMVMRAATRDFSEADGLKLVEAVEKAPAFWSLTSNEIRNNFNRFPDPVKVRAEDLCRKITDQNNQKETRLTELAGYLKGGDAARGRQVFASGKGTCIVCHRIAGLGGQVGPDLSTIGRIRTERDLLEAIAYPSASFARSYEPWIVTLNDGQVLLGTVPTDSADAIQLMPLTGVPMNIPRKNIKSMVLSTVSIMPVGLDHVLGNSDLADLVVYLRSLQ